MKQLEQARDGFPYGFLVTLVEVITEREFSLIASPWDSLPEFANVLREEVDDEAELVPEELRAHLRNFPPGKIEVEPIDKGEVLHVFGERFEQVRTLQDALDVQIYVAHVHHRRLSSEFLGPPERSFRTPCSP